ncbi:G-type lectin S-receptor-like serine/threonine-protein kinase At4g27290 [Cajanus cajan]|uniref:G-type lectin S-receptor-like serine/threonine-protein kinase At4g27290 n=1 Tax=Cajanus cajan TaxID=3821 RepID=UPI00098DCA9F|nr:G-type lectin S-receptor-like serine/threonine-protein kinase At4g27290 [Cajanus cajan]XP_020222264.1 G-type lectin S-receptor-like serine/threonine-protein kinase At4g27290 [Cajanus cajan]
MDILSSLIIVACILIPSLKVSIAGDTIVLSQSISDGMTLVSQGGKFELGFFSPGNSNNRYLGIWYKNIPQTVVWVANGAINDSSGILIVNNTGNLVLRQHDKLVWYTTSEKKAQNPVAQLLDSGNFVVREKSETNSEDYLWQSFDYPSDTILPGMKLGWNLRAGREWRMTSWKSPNDPSPGDFYWGLLLYNYPEFYLMKGTEKFVRVGPWNGLHFSGIPDQKPNTIYAYNFISNKDEMYYTYSMENDAVISRMIMNQTSSMYFRYVWIEDAQNWKLYKSLPKDNCDNYGICGAYGTCVITGSQICQCLAGFSPKSPKAWNSSDWREGCVRNKPLNCTEKLKDGFMKVEGLKVPDTTHTWVDQTIGLKECRVKCLNNCSCMAYTNSDIRGEGSGCVMWFGDLNDIRQFDNDGQDLYIRMDASELGEQEGNKKEVIIIVATTIAIIFGMLSIGCYCICAARHSITESSDIILGEYRGGSEDDLDLPLVDFSIIVTATENFSIKNKIGEGGFGPVYKGRLVSGQEIAVKRLSRTSGQGMREFKNEVKLIAKLQHRNLVKLLACCVQEQDRMLVYEYMTNRSLDWLIFDDTKSKLLDWPKRFNIICGIARGLLYLHQDSRLRIIHRDLKASNVLLDAQLNPKISDFGIAKMFGGDQTEGNTKRVVGTYGYMAPEYAADGHFSVKSDVFSFGILLLEIISGKRSRGFYIENHSPNLVTHAWSLWKQCRALEMVDSNIEDSCILSEVLRCIHISLLCVQQHAEDRPAMPSVVLMLGSESELAEPKEPGFYVKNDDGATTSISGQTDIISTNEVTITLLEAR